ncbi:hypothetical protein C8R43DRAFT_957824 [Mycena crocata]|nr:hypothetical protein C8R43DRAFT_957824 [Mycena crocata]
MQMMSGLVFCCLHSKSHLLAALGKVFKAIPPVLGGCESSSTLTNFTDSIHAFAHICQSSRPSPLAVYRRICINLPPPTTSKLHAQSRPNLLKYIWPPPSTNRPLEAHLGTVPKIRAEIDLPRDLRFLPEEDSVLLFESVRCPSVPRQSISVILHTRPTLQREVSGEGWEDTAKRNRADRGGMVDTFASEAQMDSSYNRSCRQSKDSRLHSGVLEGPVLLGHLRNRPWLFVDICRPSTSSCTQSCGQPSHGAHHVAGPERSGAVVDAVPAFV